MLFPEYIDGYEDYSSEARYIEEQRKIYRQYGLSIFESFEEYMQNREEERS